MILEGLLKLDLTNWSCFFSNKCDPLWQGFDLQLLGQAFRVKFQSLNGTRNTCFCGFFSPADQQHNLILVLSVPFSDKHNLINRLGGAVQHCVIHTANEGKRRGGERMNLESHEMQQIEPSDANVSACAREICGKWLGLSIYIPLQIRKFWNHSVSEKLT